MKRRDAKLIRLALVLHSGAALSIVATGAFGLVVLRRVSQLVAEGRQLIAAIAENG